MCSKKYLNLFILSFLERIESIERDVEYLKQNGVTGEEWKSLDEIRDSLETLKKTIKNMKEHD